MSVPAVRLEEVVRRHGGKIVLEVKSLEFAGGVLHAVTGHNGAGKTTLLRLIAGVDLPDEGRVEALGTNLRPLDARRRLSYVRQKPYMFAMSVRANVEYPLRARGIGKVEAGRRALAALERMGAAHLAARSAKNLSAGETQRVALARAVVSEPELLLLDEPFASMDSSGIPLGNRLCRELVKAGTTVIVAAPESGNDAGEDAKVLRLKEGRIAR